MTANAAGNGSVALAGGQGTILLLGPNGNVDDTVLAGTAPAL